MFQKFEKRLHATFWVSLFVVFPLTYVPPPVLNQLLGRLQVPGGEQVDTFIPKIFVFIPLWLLGAGLAVASLGRGRPGRLLTRSPRRVLLWCGLFIAALVVSSFFTLSYSSVTLPHFSDRAEGILLTLFEAAWFSFAPIAALLGARRLLPVSFLLNLMVGGALAVSGWTLAEAYGFEPWSVVVPGAKVGSTLVATLGHQGYVAAYLGVALVFWMVWRLLARQVRPRDVGISAVLTAGLVASGGRAGLLAAVLTLLAFGLNQVRFRAYRPAVVSMFVVLSVVGVAVVRSSPHAQTRLERVAVAAQGEDPSVQHRLLFWRLALKAIAREPVVGYGPYSFSNVAWRMADAQDARALIEDFLPADIARSAVRVGKLAFYQDAATERLHVKVMNPYAVHNYLLDLSLASGLPAAALFIVYVGVCARQLYRHKSPLATAALLALTTYLIYGLFWFPTHLLDPLVWSLVGLGLAGSRAAAPEPRPLPSLRLPVGYRLGLSRVSK